MFKTLIRLSLFSTLSLHFTQYIIGGYSFGHVSSYALFILTLTFLYFFLKPILALVSLPDEGVGFLFMSFVLTSITSYVSTMFIPMFSIRATTISELLIFGFMLPSKRLSVPWSVVFSALLLSVLMLFFNWICSNNRR